MDVQELRAELSSFSDSLFRLEVQPLYRVPAEDEPFARFLNGEPLPPRKANPLVEKAVAAGKWVHRCAVVDVPLSEYWQFRMALFEKAAEAVAIVERDAHPALMRQTGDFILLDADTDAPVLIDVRYDDQGHHLGWERQSDPGAVANAIHIRDLAVEHSTPVAFWRQEA